MTFAARVRRRASGRALPAPAAPGASAAAATTDVAGAANVPRTYVGLVTRAIAFGLDAALINAVAILTTAIVTLTFSVISIPESLRTVAAVVGGAVYLLWIAGYFVAFWATTGQTPGCRVLHIRVRPVNGERLLPRRALLRFLGLTLAALPLFLGFLWILVDDRRRGLHDVLARTVVVEEEPEEDARTHARDRRASSR